MEAAQAAPRPPAAGESAAAGKALAPAKAVASSRKAGARLVECGPLNGLGPSSAPRGGAAAAAHVEWAVLPGGQRVKVLSTTAKFDNRQRDKQRVESSLGLAEFGDSITEFWSTRTCEPVGCGYERIVYGDHGPYVEFLEHQLCWQSFPNFLEKPVISFYDEYYMSDGVTMLYAQKRPVTNKPNPPGGQWSAHNNCPEGYANYLPGRFYLAAEAEVITVHRPDAREALAANRRRKKAQGKAAGGADGAAAAAQDGPAPADWAEDWAAEGGEAWCEEAWWGGADWAASAAWQAPGGDWGGAQAGEGRWKPKAGEDAGGADGGDGVGADAGADASAAASTAAVSAAASTANASAAASTADADADATYATDVADGEGA